MSNAGRCVGLVIVCSLLAGGGTILATPRGVPNISDLCPQRIPPGQQTPIIVHGTNLSGATFSIGGVNLPILVDCSGSIIVHCPAMSEGTKTLTATTSSGSCDRTVVIGSLQGLSCFQMIACLALVVDQASAAGCITNAGIENALQAKLDSASRAVHRHEFDSAIHSMGAFDSLLAAQSGVAVETQLASALIGLAEAIVIPCLIQDKNQEPKDKATLFKCKLTLDVKKDDVKLTVTPGAKVKVELSGTVTEGDKKCLPMKVAAALVIVQYFKTGNKSRPMRPVRFEFPLQTNGAEEAIFDASPGEFKVSGEVASKDFVDKFTGAIAELKKKYPDGQVIPSTDDYTAAIRVFARDACGCVDSVTYDQSFNFKSGKLGNLTLCTLKVKITEVKFSLDPANDPLGSLTLEVKVKVSGFSKTIKINEEDFPNDWVAKGDLVGIATFVDKDTGKELTIKDKPMGRQQLSIPDENGGKFSVPLDSAGTEEEFSLMYKLDLKKITEDSLAAIATANGLPFDTFGDGRIDLVTLEFITDVELVDRTPCFAFDGTHFTGLGKM